MGPGPLHRHCQPIHCLQTSSPQTNGKAKVLLAHRKAWQFVALSLCWAEGPGAAFVFFDHF